MAMGSACRRCSLLPPPPLFTLGPPPNVFAIELHCSTSMKSSTRISSSSSSSTSSSSSSSSTSISIILGILIAFLIFTSTLVLIKKCLSYRSKQHRRRREQSTRRNHKTNSNESMMISSSSFRCHRHLHHHQHENWTKLMPLLSESCSSDQTSSTPPNEYPTSSSTVVIEPLLSTSDVHHEYEQIKSDDSLSGSLHYYCLIYCRQCANYHPTSSSSSSSSSICPRPNLLRPCYLPLSSNPMCQHQCACHSRTYHQPMTISRQDHHHHHHPTTTTTMTTTIDDLHPQLNFIEEMPPISSI